MKAKVKNKIKLSTKIYLFIVWRLMRINFPAVYGEFVYDMIMKPDYEWRMFTASDTFNNFCYTYKHNFLLKKTGKESFGNMIQSDFLNTKI